MRGLVHDIRYAIRQLRRSPLFPAAAIGTLSLGIGAGTALFSVGDAALLRPLPVSEPDRLVLVHLRTGSGRDERLPATAARPAAGRRPGAVRAGRGVAA